MMHNRSNRYISSMTISSKWQRRDRQIPFICDAIILPIKGNLSKFDIER